MRGDSRWIVLPLLVVLSCGLLGCGGSKPDYGRDGENPFGSFTKLDGLLRGLDLEREIRPCDLSTMDGDSSTTLEGYELENAKRYSYRDRARSGSEHRVFVYVDGKGRVAGVGGSFRSDDRGFALGLYKVGRFVGEYWRELIGIDPSFGPAPSAAGMIGKEMLVATGGAHGIRARWVKHVVATEMGDQILDEVVFFPGS